MTQTTILEKALIELAVSIGSWQDSNPDVGMGPWPFMLVDEALERLGEDKNQLPAGSYETICEAVRLRRSRR